MSPTSDAEQPSPPPAVEAGDAPLLTWMQGRVRRHQSYRADQRERRWRSVLAWVISLLLHLGLVFGILLAPVDMPSPPPPDRDQALMVQLLPPPPPPPEAGGAGGRGHMRGQTASSRDGAISGGVRHGAQSSRHGSMVGPVHATVRPVRAAPVAATRSPAATHASARGAVRRPVAFPQLPATSMAIHSGAPPVIAVTMPAMQPVVSGVIQPQRPPRAEGNQPMPSVQPAPQLPAAAPVVQAPTAPRMEAPKASATVVPTLVASAPVAATETPHPQDDMPAVAAADAMTGTVLQPVTAPATGSGTASSVMPTPTMAVTAVPATAVASADLPALPDDQLPNQAVTVAPESLARVQTAEVQPPPVDRAQTVAAGAEGLPTLPEAGRPTAAPDLPPSQARLTAPAVDASPAGLAPDPVAEPSVSAGQRSGNEGTSPSQGQPAHSGEAADASLAQGERAGTSAQAASEGGLSEGRGGGLHDGQADGQPGGRPGGQVGGVVAGQPGGRPGGVAGHQLGGANGQAGAAASEPGHAAAPGHYISLRAPGQTDVGPSRSVAIDYHRTRFDKDWVPDDENQLDSAMRHIGEKIHSHHRIHLPGGVSFHCDTGAQPDTAGSQGLGSLLPFGCHGDAPPQASAKDGDRRLDQAPARPLAGKAATAAAPPLPRPVVAPVDNTAMCETARIAGGPLPPGCQVREYRQPVPASSTSWAPPLDRFH